MPTYKNKKRIRKYKKKAGGAKYVVMSKRNWVMKYRGGRNPAMPLYLGYLFPNRLRVKLPYYDSDNKNVNAVANGSCNWTYRANGMFDPLLAGPVGSTGHQPMGFDQLASIYHGYTVKGCKLSIQLLAGSTTTSSGAMQIFVYPNPETTTLWATLANVNSLRETDKVRYKIIPTAYTMNQKDRSIKYYASTKSVIGINDSNDPDLQVLLRQILMLLGIGMLVYLFR